MPNLETGDIRTERDVPSDVPARSDDLSPLSAPQPTLARFDNGSAATQPWTIDRKSYAFTGMLGQVTNHDTAVDFRSGEILFEPDQMTVRGKVALPIIIRIPAAMATVPFFHFGAGIVVFLLEFAIRLKRIDVVPRERMKAVVLESEKHQACIAFRASDNPNKTYSVGIKLKQDVYGEFVKATHAFLPDRVNEGIVSSRTPFWELVILFVSALLGIGIAIATGWRP